MKGRIVVEIDEIPEDCYQCNQTDNYAYCRWIDKYIDRCCVAGERHLCCPIEPWEGKEDGE